MYTLGRVNCAVVGKHLCAKIEEARAGGGRTRLRRKAEPTALDEGIAMFVTTFPSGCGFGQLLSKAEPVRHDEVERPSPGSVAVG